MAIIIPANSAAVTAYSIENSVRYNKPDSPSLIRTASESGNAKTFAFSCWLKRSQGSSSAWGSTPLTGDFSVLVARRGSGYRYTNLPYFNGADDTLWGFGGTFAGGSPVIYDWKTNARYRDPGAWMHYYCAIDNSQAVEANRHKFYINGVQLLDANTSSADIMGQDVDTFYNNTSDGMSIGADDLSGVNFDGYIAECAFVDGTTPAVTEFGEFDEDSPTIWKPKDLSKSSITWGTNGAWLDFKDSSALGNDVSGNNNDWATNGLAAVDQCTDTPTNNFCTMNPLDNFYAGATLSEGNTQIVTQSGTSKYTFNTSTIGLTSGKWYVELLTPSPSSDNSFGISPQVTDRANGGLGSEANSGDDAWSYSGADGKYYTEHATGVTYGDSWNVADDLVGLALDLDNNKLYFHKDGTWQNSGDPTSGATGTGALSITAAASTVSGHYFIAAGDYSTGVATLQLNFGNPAWTLSSAVADENGYGAFEYAPPSGYLAICTKNLGSDGG